MPSSPPFQGESRQKLGIPVRKLGSRGASAAGYSPPSPSSTRLFFGKPSETMVWDRRM